MAEVKGPEFVQQDYMMRLTHNDTLHKPYLETAPAHLKDAVTAFAAGIQSYVSGHPGEAKEVSIPIEPWHPLAVGRAMILRWPIGTIMDDLKNGEQRAKPAAGSNQWTVSPKRSAESSSLRILTMNQHQLCTVDQDRPLSKGRLFADRGNHGVAYDCSAGAAYLASLHPETLTEQL